MNFPLIHLGPQPLVFTCPNCQVEMPDSSCDLCGRPLTANDLTTKSAPAAHLAASTAEAINEGSIEHGSVNHP